MRKSSLLGDRAELREERTKGARELHDFENASSGRSFEE
jgi:hypothetical protein